MAISLGTKGMHGVSLVRDTKTFKKNMSEIDWSKRREIPAPVVQSTRAGVTTYRYGVK